MFIVLLSTLIELAEQHRHHQQQSEVGDDLNRATASDRGHLSGEVLLVLVVVYLMIQVDVPLAQCQLQVRRRHIGPLLGHRPVRDIGDQLLGGEQTGGQKLLACFGHKRADEYRDHGQRHVDDHFRVKVQQHTQLPTTKS